MAPDRADVLVLASTVYPTVPLPVSLAPLVTRIQALLLTAVQSQVDPVVTPTLPDAPEAPGAIEVGERL
jgi:hypothetical protein